MRNPERIDEFLQKLGTLWKDKYPDWRFGQLIMNFLYEAGDVFYYEENHFLIAFKAFLNNEDPKQAVVNYIEKEWKTKEDEQKNEDELP